MENSANTRLLLTTPVFKKNKYKPGNVIRTLDELSNQEFVYFHEKVYHKGWFSSWPLRLCKTYLSGGKLKTAVRDFGYTGPEVIQGSVGYTGSKPVELLVVTGSVGTSIGLVGPSSK